MKGQILQIHNIGNSENNYSKYQQKSIITILLFQNLIHN